MGTPSFMLGFLALSLYRADAFKVSLNKAGPHTLKFWKDGKIVREQIKQFSSEGRIGSPQSARFVQGSYRGYKNMSTNCWIRMGPLEYLPVKVNSVLLPTKLKPGEVGLIFVAKQELTRGR